MRLDVYLAQSGLARSRSEAANLIKLGAVFVGGAKADAPSMSINPDNLPEIEITSEIYASVGALKLKAALDYWHPEIADKIALDAGASTGGFTDLLLKRGAKRVYAVDIGQGLLRDELRQDNRVKAIENTNIRNMTLETISEKCDIITVDLSFISLKLVLDNLKQFLAEDGMLIALVKPQFELGASALNKQGIVKDEQLALSAVEDVKSFAEQCGYKTAGYIPAPRDFQKKNREYLLNLTF
jgi:23S rRNA (cytidine1920-2'-O)/16S rRNA (cytidine1409-2'-O)-methyltransferase